MQINKIQATIPQAIATKNNNNQQVSFGSAASLAKKVVGDGTLAKLNRAIEFDGLNMSFPILLTTMAVGVVIPRVIKAQDEYDREEIIRRDLISCLVLSVGDKVIKKNLSRISEAKSGFALAMKDNFANKTKFQKAMDYLKPTKGVRVLNNDQIVAKYSGLEKYKNGIADFCDFITEQGGNLKKVFSLKEGGTQDIVEKIVGKEVFEAGDNKTIRDALATAAEHGTEEIKQLYSKFAAKDNPFVVKAKSMNSKFAFLSLFVFVPVLLGFAIPKINEKITKKKFLERQAQEAAKVAETPVSKPQVNFLTSSAFQDITK